MLRYQSFLLIHRTVYTRNVPQTICMHEDRRNVRCSLRELLIIIFKIAFVKQNQILRNIGKIFRIAVENSGTVEKV